MKVQDGSPAKAAGRLCIEARIRIKKRYLMQKSGNTRTGRDANKNGVVEKPLHFCFIFYENFKAPS